MFSIPGRDRSLVSRPYTKAFARLGQRYVGRYQGKVGAIGLARTARL